MPADVDTVLVIVCRQQPEEEATKIKHAKEKGLCRCKRGKHPILPDEIVFVSEQPVRPCLVDRVHLGRRKTNKLDSLIDPKKKEKTKKIYRPKKKTSSSHERSVLATVQACTGIHFRSPESSGTRPHLHDMPRLV